jgi:hypothetical protein
MESGETELLSKILKTVTAMSAQTMQRALTADRACRQRPGVADAAVALLAGSLSP